MLPPLNEALQEGCTYICGFVVEVAVVENSSMHSLAER